MLAIASHGGGGCAARRPVLYPNAHLKGVGESGAAADIAECERLADAYGTSSGSAKRAARHTAVGGGAGAAIGAAGGAVHGAAGRGAGIGAASGATAGFLHALLGEGKPSSTYKKFVETCLHERGYRVLGWE